MNILALLAHPDDVECICAGTLLRYKEAGHNIYIALTTSGNTGANHIASREEIMNIREAEQLKAAKYLDAQVMFLRYEDESLFDTPFTRRSVLTAIRWANPDVIFTHNPRDLSTDHNMTSRLVTAVLPYVGDKFAFADLPPIDNKPHVFFEGKKCFVDITEQMAVKMQMLRSYESQIAWMGTFYDDKDFTEQLESKAKMLGKWCGGGVTYAEGFDAYKTVGQIADYHLLP